MSNATSLVVLALPTVLLGAIALATGWGLLWIACGASAVAAMFLVLRRQAAAAAEFPSVEIHAETEGPTAFVRMTNMDGPDTFTAVLRRVTFEDSLTEPLPWSVPWQGVTGRELEIGREESGRLEIGRVEPPTDDSSPAFHFASPASPGGSRAGSMPWPSGAGEIDAGEVDGGSIGERTAYRRIRAEVEITSEGTGRSRLVQLRIGVRPETWGADLQLVSIDLGRTVSAVPAT